jgi:hypothetical protein
VVKLPEGTHENGVVRLIDHLKVVMNSRRKPICMPNIMNTYESLSVCAAAKLLDTEKHADYILRKVEAYFRIVELPTYDDLDAALIFMDDYPGFFKIVVQKMEKLTREDKIEDIADFNEYLAQQTVLADAIKVANTKHANWVRES